jgi:hypothetical protein
MLGNISALVETSWYLGMCFQRMALVRQPKLSPLGIPFNDTTNFRLGIAQLGLSVLGDRLIGLQAGNEPE